MSNLAYVSDTSESHIHLSVRVRSLLIKTLSDLLTGRERYVLLDFPDYGNVGDSAIWSGEVTALRDIDLGAPHFVSDLRDGTDSAQIGDVDLILLNGGGNFGDLWPDHQTFREDILRRYPDKMVVQLPQSIHYDDPANITRTAEAISGHRNFHLLVRDHESLDLARRHFACNAVLCPDAAFAMGPMDPIGAPEHDVLLLLRTDKEKVGGDAPINIPAHWRIEDWLEDTLHLHRETLRETRLRALMTLNPAEMSADARRLRYFNRLAEKRIDRGLRQLSAARFIITDRLHVHILSTLIGRPHVFLDNRYGKISRFSEAFGTLWSEAHRATSMDQAIAIAHRYLAGENSSTVSA